MFFVKTCNDVILLCCSELLSRYEVGEEYLTGELADSFFRVRPQFVIVAAFDHTDPDLPVEERVALGLKRCGVSITCKYYHR